MTSMSVFGLTTLVAMVAVGGGLPPLPVSRAPFERTGEARQPVKMVVSDFPYRGETHKGVRFVSGDKSVLMSGADHVVDCNNRLAFGRIVVYAGTEALATLYITKGWGCVPGKEDEPVVDAAKGTATWRLPWKSKDGKDRTWSYTLHGDDRGHVFVDYDLGLTDDEARKEGQLPFISSVGLPTDRCLDRVYGMGSTPHAAQDQAHLAQRPPPYHQDAVPVEQKCDTFFYEPDNEVRHFTITLPKDYGRSAYWFEGLSRVGSDNEGHDLHLRYFVFSDFKQPSSPARTKGRFVIDLCKSSARLHKGEPAWGGIDFWGTDALHVPKPPTRNLLSNGSFEQNWKDWTWGYGGAQTPKAAPGQERYQLVDRGLDGGKALDIRQSQYGVLWLRSASVPTVAGRKYTLSWYAMTTNAWCNLLVTQASAGRGGKYHWLGRNKEETKDVGKEWKRFSRTFEADAAGVFVMVYGHGVLVDRIMLEEGDRMTDYVEDPVQARLLTSSPDNDLRPGQPIDARIEFQGMNPVRANVHVTVKNFYSEIVHDETFDIDIEGGTNRTTVPLALDAKRLGTGVFVVRMDFRVQGRRWTDYRRFVICEPLGNTHATARFFCAMPWHMRIDRSRDVARKMKEYGFGSLGAQMLGNDGYVKNPYTASLCRENDIKLILHPVLYELPLPEMNKWHKLETKDLTDALFARLEAMAYTNALQCAADDTLWTFFNEEETMARRIGFENHYRLIEAAYKGCRRAFDERGLKLGFTPTHGVSHYFNGRNYDTVDSYLETARKHAFRYDAVSIHSYQNIDGSILGPKDAEIETQHLIDRMRFYGYPDETPILLSECYNMLPWHVPAWGASGWSDYCWSGKPSEDLGFREFVHAGAMARLYLLALRFYPKVAQVNTWQSLSNAFIDHDLQPMAWLKMVNTLGHLFPNPTYFGGARPYPDVRGHVYLQDDKAILAVWTSNNDVERGKRKGAVLTMTLPEGVRFVDLMGNKRVAERVPSAEKVPSAECLVLSVSKDTHSSALSTKHQALSTTQHSSALSTKHQALSTRLPLTPAPLFIVSEPSVGADPRAARAAALLAAVRTAQTDDPSQAIEAEVRPTVDGAVELELVNATSVPQQVNFGGGKGPTLAANAKTVTRLAPGKSVRPMEMYAFATNYPFLAKPWKMSYFYVSKCGAKPDWSRVPSLPIANEVRRSPGKPVTMKADYKLAWNESRLFLRVEVEDDVVLRRSEYPPTDLRHNYLIDQCLEVYFDAFADARKSSVEGFDLNDSRYDFSSGTVWRMLAVNWQLAQGTASATDEEVSQKLEQTCTPTAKGCVYEIAFAPRYLAPIELKAGTRASLGLFVHDRDKLTDKGENGLSNATGRGKVCNLRPDLWPEFILIRGCVEAERLSP